MQKIGTNNYAAIPRNKKGSMGRIEKMREELYVIEGVPFRDNQIIEALHMGHQGINGMMANARK